MRQLLHNTKQMLVIKEDKRVQRAKVLTFYYDMKNINFSWFVSGLAIVFYAICCGRQMVSIDGKLIQLALIILLLKLSSFGYDKIVHLMKFCIVTVFFNYYLFLVLSILSSSCFLILAIFTCFYYVTFLVFQSQRFLYH